MLSELRYIKTLLLRLLLVTALFSLCRILFYLFNHHYFSDLHFGELLWTLFYGVKFDLPAILVINLPFILLSLLPLNYRDKSGYQKLQKFIFLLGNSIALIANCVDLVYFKFTLKRTTADIFSFISTGDDFTRLLPLFIKDYWFLFIFFFAMLWLMIFAYKRTSVIQKQSSVALSPFIYLTRHSILIVLSLCFFLLIYRGGFQLKPISIISAGQYVSAKNIPLLISTPFSIIKTIEQEGIKETNYFSQTQLERLYNPIHLADTGKFKNMNVVLIIMESFSKEYCGSMNHNRGYTPFLDSLMNKSLVFENAFANGKRSMEGIPACVASLPTLMNEPYITSNYNSNQIRPLALLLKEKGYQTSFYHAATNGSMGFDNFSKLAGYDSYIGRTEYNNEKDYDGHWGIWDEEFFQYFAQGLSKTKEPFFSTFFSLTSHHPYPVPDKYKNNFREGELSIEKSISYSDYALKKFFETASAMTWFDHTLFIIVADHTGEAYRPSYSSSVGMFRIPLLFYSRSETLAGKCSKVVQQIDIMPSVLDYLNYDKDYFSFGKSVFDTLTEGYAFTYINNNYQVISQHYALQFNGDKAIALYGYDKDSLLQHNLLSVDTTTLAPLQNHLKAFMQTYHHSLISNQMSLRK